MSDADDDEQTHDLPEEWSAGSNDCFHITLLRPDGTDHTTFQPSYTYPIFGENEVIFGYKDLEIELTFTAHTLEPRIRISHAAVFEEQGGIKPTNIKAALRDFLVTEAWLDTKLSFIDAEKWKPPGEKIRIYKKGGKTFEVRCASMADEEARRLLQRMQVLVPLFIEGGTMLSLEQDWVTERWKLFTTYEVQTTISGAAQYSLIGYGTSYRVFAAMKSDNVAVNSHEPDFLSQDLNGLSSPLALPSRERLSQFLILPKFQGSGHGQELYRAMCHQLTESDNVREFTVEDPNEAFDDLRDFCDITYLRARNNDFAALEINTEIPEEVFGKGNPVPLDKIVSAVTRDTIRTTTKIETRQFNRLVEMQTLNKIPAANRSRNRITRREKTKNKHDKQYYLWRLYVKQRLLIFNEEALKQLDHAERVEKLEAAVDANQEHYTEILDKVLSKEAAGIEIDGEHDTVNGALKRKRKIVDDEEDDEDAMSDTSKRSRMKLE